MYMANFTPSGRWQAIAAILLGILVLYLTWTLEPGGSTPKDGDCYDSGRGVICK
jgi:hypothetical protein